MAMYLAGDPLLLPPTGRFLQPFVRGELDGAMTDAEERGHQAAVEPTHAFVAPHDLPPPVQHAAVGAGRAPSRRQHARLDHPDRVGQDGGQRAGRARRRQVIERV